jgi:hypothetical protein
VSKNDGYLVEISDEGNIVSTIPKGPGFAFYGRHLDVDYSWVTVLDSFHGRWYFFSEGVIEVCDESDLFHVIDVANQIEKWDLTPRELRRMVETENDLRTLKYGVREMSTVWGEIADLGKGKWITFANHLDDHKVPFSIRKQKLPGDKFRLMGTERRFIHNGSDEDYYERDEFGDDWYCWSLEG